MKIAIEQRKSKNRGSSNFLDQLSIAMQEMGHEITDNKPDIALCSVKINDSYKCPTVLRVDGIYYDKAREGMNKSIMQSLAKADGVIYQSQFSKKMIKHMLKLPAIPNAVIHNGVNNQLFKAFIKQKQSDHTFVSCAHWRINKRPKEIAEAFLLANIENSILYMIGDVPKEYIISNPKIHYLGNLNRNEVMQTYINSDYMIHICHIDSCPNSVVEGLVAGLPVVCNNISGTPEIVRESGIISNIDPSFDFKFIKTMDNIPKINTNILSDSIKLITSQKIQVERPDLHINNSALQYISLFNNVLK